jgi:hypothetical protein
MIENISINPELASQLPKTFVNITNQCDIIQGNIYNYMVNYPKTVFWFLLVGWFAMLLMIYLPLFLKKKSWFKQWQNEIDKSLMATAFIFIGTGIYQMIPLTFKLTVDQINRINNIMYVLLLIVGLLICLKYIFFNKGKKPIIKLKQK